MLTVIFAIIITFQPSFAADPKIQNIPLSFRPGNKAGVLAKVEIQGKAFDFLVDTGASGHSVHFDVVTQLGLPLGKVGSGSTPYGEIQTLDLGTVAVRINSAPFDLHETITVKGEQCGLADDSIFGLLSVSRFAKNKLAILDLNTPALILVDPVPKDVNKWLVKNFPQFDFEKISRVPDQAYVEKIKVKTSIFGHLTMTVDSGATVTNIYSDMSLEEFHPVEIKTKKFKCNTRSARIRPLNSPGNQNHLLGMDCLRDRVLVFPPVGNAFLWMGSKK